jgi:LPS sulfotransferase NodH
MSDRLDLFYLIVGTRRTGTTLLCELLKDAGAGLPYEYLGTEEYPFIDSWAAYAARIREAQPGAVAGLKCMWGHFDMLVGNNALMADGDLTPALALDRLIAAMDTPNVRFIYLTRHDKVRQAVSAERARQTTQWHLWDETWEPVAHTMPYQPQRITREIQWYLEAERRWQRYFQTRGVQPLWLVYEQLVADLSGTFARVADWLGLSLDMPPVRMQKMAGPDSERVVQRYKRDHPVAMEAMAWC